MLARRAAAHVTAQPDLTVALAWSLDVRSDTFTLCQFAANTVSPTTFFRVRPESDS